MTGFSENDGGFNYAKQNLAGAKYGLYAKEDIMDDSGKLIWAKDTLIDEKTTTGTDAVWFTNDVLTPSDNFYMGSYYVKELEAPAGCDIDETKHDVNLTWQAGAKDSEIGAWEPDDDAEFSEQGSKGKNFLAQGSKLNPYIVNAKKVVFTYEKAPEGVDVWDVSADGILTMLPIVVQLFSGMIQKIQIPFTFLVRRLSRRLSSISFLLKCFTSVQI